MQLHGWGAVAQPTQALPVQRCVGLAACLLALLVGLNLHFCLHARSALLVLQARPQSQPARSRDAGDDLSYLARDSTLRSERDSRGRSDGSKGSRSSSSNSERDARTGLFGRTSSSGSYGSITNKGGSGWGGRGKQKGKDGPMTLEELEDIDEEDLSPAKRKVCCFAATDQLGVWCGP